MKIPAAHDRIQHELRPARAISVRSEIQRATDGHPGRGRILPEAATSLQAGTGTLYHVGRVGRATSSPPPSPSSPPTLSEKRCVILLG